MHFLIPFAVFFCIVMMIGAETALGAVITVAGVFGIIFAVLFGMGLYNFANPPTYAETAPVVVDQHHYYPPPEHKTDRLNPRKREHP